MSTFRHRPPDPREAGQQAARPEGEGEAPVLPASARPPLWEVVGQGMVALRNAALRIVDAVAGWLESCRDYPDEARRVRRAGPMGPVGVHEVAGALHSVAGRIAKEDQVLAKRSERLSLDLAATADLRHTDEKSLAAAQATLAAVDEGAPLSRAVVQGVDGAALAAATRAIEAEAQLHAEEAAAAAKKREADRADEEERKREAAERVAAEQAVRIAVCEMADARAALADADRETPRPARERVEPEATATVASRDRARRTRDLILDEASYPIPWVDADRPAYLRTAPAGAFPVAERRSERSAVLGATGRFASIDWTTAQAATQAAAILRSSEPPVKCGRPPKILGHLVLALPPSELWAVADSTAKGMRAARQALRALGVDPRRHDVVVFHHSTRKTENGGKNEEALHVLYNRVRDDGALHDCKNAFVAVALGRARWDDAAGFDPERLKNIDQKSQPVRDGLKALKDRSLHAEFKIDGKVAEKVALLGREHAAALGREGMPEGIAGVWTPKPHYGRADFASTITYMQKG